METTERARIIRYTSLDDLAMPGLLSFFEAEKNILHIDQQEAARLPDAVRHNLEMTTVLFTKVVTVGAGVRFSEYNTKLAAE